MSIEMFSSYQSQGFTLSVPDINVPFVPRALHTQDKRLKQIKFYVLFTY